MTPRRHRRSTATLRLLILPLLALAALCTACGRGAHRPEAQTRSYFIAADEVDWDYAPGGNLAGPQVDDHAPTYLERVPYDGVMPVAAARIGKVYRKALYRAYTDGSFTQLAPVAPEWQHLGLYGPAIRAAVGDTIQVTFRNHTGRRFSVHPHGVFYTKDSEGAGYPDGTSGGDLGDDAVEPGGTHVYTWQVPERAGPGPADPSSIAWMYHSHVDETDDTYAGLVGPMIISRAEDARDDGSPADVDREIVAIFHVFNENLSPYLDDNVARFAGVTGDDAVAELEGDDDFIESNLMHTINGFVYANVPAMRARVGERVRWYLMGMGTEVDIHTPHWHGNTVTVNGTRTDVTSVFPATMMVADMVPDDPGTWLFHCHVNDHLDAGMIALYTIEP